MVPPRLLQALLHITENGSVRCPDTSLHHRVPQCIPRRNSPQRRLVEEKYHPPSLVSMGHQRSVFCTLAMLFISMWALLIHTAHRCSNLMDHQRQKAPEGTSENSVVEANTASPAPLYPFLTKTSTPPLPQEHTTMSPNSSMVHILRKCLKTTSMTQTLPRASVVSAQP